MSFPNCGYMFYKDFPDIWERYNMINIACHSAGEKSMSVGMTPQPFLGCNEESHHRECITQPA